MRYGNIWHNPAQVQKQLAGKFGLPDSNRIRLAKFKVTMADGLPNQAAFKKALERFAGK